MIKTLLRLLASSASLVAVLFVTQVAIAAPQINLDNHAPISLNINSSTLALVSEGNNFLLDHLGCTCAVCTQSLSQMDTI